MVAASASATAAVSGSGVYTESDEIMNYPLGYPLGGRRTQTQKETLPKFPSVQSNSQA